MLLVKVIVKNKNNLGQYYQQHCQHSDLLVSHCSLSIAESLTLGWRCQLLAENSS